MDIKDFSLNKISFEILEDSEEGLKATNWFIKEFHERCCLMFEEKSDEIWDQVEKEARIIFKLTS